jgi:hypothetical protein
VIECIKKGAIAMDANRKTFRKQTRGRIHLKSDCEVVWTKDKEIDFKAFDYYEAITSTGTPQYDMRTDSRNSINGKGFHVWTDGEQVPLYMISCSANFGEIGEILTAHLKDGTKISMIIGQEIHELYLDDDNVHIFNGGVVCFLVDRDTFHLQNHLAVRMENASYVEGLGSPVVKITKGLAPEFQLRFQLLAALANE